MIQELIERIKANVPAIKLVGTAADFQAAAESSPAITPACFVISLGENPAANALADIIVQHVQAAVGIVLVVRNVTDAKGAAAGIDMESLRKLVKAQVYGWVALPELAPFERGASDLLAWRTSHLWWQDIYLTSYYDRSDL